MYAYSFSGTFDDLKEGVRSESRKEIAYWRKHNNLHGWMENLYREKGGVGTFNCTPVELTFDDLLRLQQDIVFKKNLKPQEGFFFGSQEEYTYEDAECDLEFIGKAMYEIAIGNKVVYDSWW